jgi:hypothetical protein
MKKNLLMALGIAAFALGSGRCPLHAQDITPPFLLSAASVDGMQVGLRFSEPMSRLDLDDPFSYAVGDEFSAVGIDAVAIRSADGVVVLRLSSAITSPFRVVIQTGSLSDLAGNPLPFGATVTGTVWSAGLTLADVGFPAPPGSVISCLPGQLDVDAGGRNIGEGADQFTYLHQSRTNNFDVRVRVDGFLYVCHATAKAGIHIRQSLDAGSPFFMAYLTPTNGANQIIARARTQAGQNAADFSERPPVNGYPVWLRVKRSERTLTAFHSHDGESW